MTEPFLRDDEEPPPPPMLKVKPVGYMNGTDDLVLPRPYLWLDGDNTNALISIGVDVGTRFCDPFMSFGLELVIPPSLFPVLRKFGWR